VKAVVRWTSIMNDPTTYFDNICIYLLTRCLSCASFNFTCFHILMMCIVILHIFICLSLAHIIMSHVKYKRSKNKNFYFLLKSFFFPSCLLFQIVLQVVTRNSFNQNEYKCFDFFFFFSSFFCLLFSQITFTNVYENDFHALTLKLCWFFNGKNLSQVIWIGSFKELIRLSAEKFFFHVFKETRVE